MDPDCIMATVDKNAQSTVSINRRSYQVVIAATRDMGIGIDLKLPWDLPTDFQFFQDVTTKTSDPRKRNAAIMGRKTWESTPLEIRPLPGRLNIVLTKSNSLNIADGENVLVSSSMESALELLATAPYSLSIEKVFLLGGGELLRHYMNAPSCGAIHLTEIDISVPCDAFAPRVDTSLYCPWYSSFPIVENGIRFTFNTFVRIIESGENKSIAGLDFNDVETNQYSFLPKMVFERHEKFGYLNLVQNIISNGDMMNENSTLSKFGCQMRFNLRKTFPLLATKKVFWLGVVEAVLQLINGSTNPKEKGSSNHIWDSDEGRKYLDSFRANASEVEEGHPLFWRHSDASQEFNQIAHVINEIKNNPHNRRIMLSACGPVDFAQFYVTNGELSCQIYQSSTEASIGISFSIAAYALLTHIIAHVCDLVAGDFIHVIGEAHVNTAHIKAIQKQLQISPIPFPILKINPEKTKIDNFEASDLELFGI